MQTTSGEENIFRQWLGKLGFPALYLPCKYSHHYSHLEVQQV